MQIELNNVRWKALCCGSGDQCWCRVIAPEETILDEEGDPILIVNAGALPREHAYHIVEAHNAYIAKTAHEVNHFPPTVTDATGNPAC